VRGLKKIGKFHEENTGLPYHPFKIKDDLPKDKQFAKVRVLAHAEPDYDDEGGEIDNGKPVIQAIFMHQAFRVVNSTRCVNNDSAQPVPEECPLCRVKCPRSLRTFIPVRVRNDEDEKRVQIIEYGRNHLTEVQNFIEEREDADITGVDIKIKRIGKKKDTEYRWTPILGTERPLDEQELALEIPDMLALIPVKEESELEKRAMEFERAMKAKKVKGEDADDDDDDDDNEEDDDDADEKPRSKQRKVPF
jgi:hypothetical protein